MSATLSSPRMSYQRHTPYWLLLLPALAIISLFVIKYQVGELNRQVVQLENDLNQLGDREQVLQTEWTYLNRPEYLQKLNDRFHHLQAPNADQIVDWAEVNSRLHQAQSHYSNALVPANDNNPGLSNPGLGLPSPAPTVNTGDSNGSDGRANGQNGGAAGQVTSPKTGTPKSNTIGNGAGREAKP